MKIFNKQALFKSPETIAKSVHLVVVLVLQSNVVFTEFLTRALVGIRTLALDLLYGLGMP